MNIRFFVSLCLLFCMNCLAHGQDSNRAIDSLERVLKECYPSESVDRPLQVIFRSYLYR